MDSDSQSKDRKQFLIGERTSRYQTTNQLLEYDAPADYDYTEPNDTYHKRLCELVKHSDPTIKSSQPKPDQFHKPNSTKPTCQMVTHARMTNYKHVNLLSCTKGIPCGLLTCPACSSAWRSKWRAIISYGCHQLIDMDGYFLTLTAQNLRPNEPNDEILFRLHESFYTFRKNFLNRYLKGSYYFMIYELGSKRLRPHQHMLLYPPEPIPTNDKRSRYTNELDWVNSMSDDAINFQNHLINHGYGRIFHSEKLRNGPAGATSYLGKYLAKSNVKSIDPRDTRVSRYLDRSLRVCNTSRNWPRNRHLETFFHGTTLFDYDNKYHQIPMCNCKPSNPQELHREIDIAKHVWLEPLQKFGKDVVFPFVYWYVRSYRQYYQLYSKHRQLISDPGPETLQLKTVNYQLRQLLRDRNTAKRQLEKFGYKGSQKFLFYIFKYPDLLTSSSDASSSSSEVPRLPPALLPNSSVLPLTPSNMYPTPPYAR
jgi:hypothetical protein